MIEPIRYNAAVDAVEIIDQTKLPRVVETVRIKDPDRMCRAIRRLELRGAPAIGIGGAFGVFLGLKTYSGKEPGLLNHLKDLVLRLNATRPTAVNLSWALHRTHDAVELAYAHAPVGSRIVAARSAALATARAIHEEDVAMCHAIGRFGAPFVGEGQGWLTHCNAGALATGGFGTALGVFRSAWEEGRRFTVFVDETRPLLQGSRLTAFELVEDGIPAVLICDNMAGGLMAAGRIQGVVVGADRITAHGYVANKTGTYGVAVLAKHHGIPFYVAAPGSTFDLTLRHGRDIVIEERDRNEITNIGDTELAPKGVSVYNPAFDVTPPDLITAIITNLGVVKPPFGETIPKLLAGPRTSGERA